MAVGLAGKLVAALDIDLGNSDTGRKLAVLEIQYFVHELEPLMVSDPFSRDHKTTFQSEFNFSNEFL